MRSGKRVLIILENIPIARDRRVQREILALREAGYSVSLICPSEREEYGTWEAEGVSIYRYPAPKGGSGLFSYIYEFAYSFAKTTRLSLRVFRKEGFDIIHACNPPDIFFLIALMFKPFGKKFLFDQHDLSPELYLSKFGRKDFAHRLLLFFERMTYRLADVVFVTNESFKEVALSRGKVAPEKLFVVRNGPFLYEPQLLKADDSPKKGFKSMVCCLGEITAEDGLEYLVKAADRLVNEEGRQDVLFTLIGDGDFVPEIMRMIEAHRLEKYFLITGWVSDKKLLHAYLSAADVCVYPQPENPSTDRSTAVKVLDFMAAAKPVVAFDMRETRYTAGAAARYARPNDDRDLAMQIANLLDDPAEARRLGMLGRERLERNLLWEHSKPNLLEGYALISGKADECWPELELADLASVEPTKTLEEAFETVGSQADDGNAKLA